MLVFLYKNFFLIIFFFFFFDWGEQALCLRSALWGKACNIYYIFNTQPDECKKFTNSIQVIIVRVCLIYFIRYKR